MCLRYLRLLRRKPNGCLQITELKKGSKKDAGINGHQWRHLLLNAADSPSLSSLCSSELLPAEQVVSFEGSRLC